jgi:hypothetical protein
MAICYRRFNNGSYLLTCELLAKHTGNHRDGKETWPATEGFSDEYTGAPVAFDPERQTVNCPLHGRKEVDIESDTLFCPECGEKPPETA